MRDDMKLIAEKAHLMRIHNEKLQKHHMSKIYKLFYLQREKSNIAKVNERLKYVNMLR